MLKVGLIGEQTTVSIWISGDISQYLEFISAFSLIKVIAEKRDSLFQKLIFLTMLFKILLFDFWYRLWFDM